MRQIDNMTPNEIDTLAIKGMTAQQTTSRNLARVITEKGITAEKPTAANVPHSVPATPYVIEACNNYDTLRAQAEQLAEALKQAQAWLIACSDKDYTYARQAVAIKASETLSAWEKANQ